MQMQKWQMATIVLWFLAMTGVYLALGAFSGYYSATRTRLSGNETNWIEEISMTWVQLSNITLVGIAILWFSMLASLPFWVWLYCEFEQ
jgi:hypothetical protein